MATYAKEKGFTVQTVSTDPANSQLEGGSWAAGGNLNERRYAGASAGSQTAAFIAGGYSPTHPTPQDVLLLMNTIMAPLGLKLEI